VLVERLGAGQRRLDRGALLVAAVALADRARRRGRHVLHRLGVGVPVGALLRHLVGLDLGAALGRRLQGLLRRRVDGVLQLDRADRLLVAGPDLLRLLEQRVLHQLAAYEVLQLVPRELQELDRLLQLRGHHQLLAHPQVLPHLKCHGPSPR